MSAILFATLAGLFTCPSLCGQVATPGDAVDYTGTVYFIQPDYTTQEEVYDQSFAFVADYQCSGGGGTTSMEVYLLTSLDGGATWRLAAEMPAITAGQHLSQVVITEGLGSFIAVVTKLSGSPNPTQIFKAWLASNGRFKLVAQSSSIVVDTTFASPTTSPTVATEAWTSEQLENLKWKAPVRACTTTTLPAYVRSGNVITANAVGALPAIDGVTLVAGERLLLKDGAAGADNGVYTVTTVGNGATRYVLTRAVDFDSSNHVKAQSKVSVEEGTTLARSIFTLSTVNPIVLNTTPLAFTQFVNTPTPVSDSDQANKFYVDATVATHAFKSPVRVATTTTLPAYTRVGNVITENAFGALPAIDGVTLIAGERLLLKNGAAGSDNGIYVVTNAGGAGAAFVLTRATDADSSAKVKSELAVLVEEGTTQTGYLFRCTTANPINLNTTGLTFSGALQVPTPTAGQDAAPRDYVQSQDRALRWKAPVRASTVGSLPAYTRVSNVITENAPGALPAQDGVTLINGERLLLKNGASAADNGIYVVSDVGSAGTPFILTRAADMDANEDIASECAFLVEEGTTLAERQFRLSTPNPINLNVTNLTFVSYVVAADPSADQQVVPRLFMQNQLRALRWKDPVRLATAAPLAAYTRVANRITANAPGAMAAVDGVAVVNGDRILLRNGAAPQDNGIYTITDVGGGGPFILDRAQDFDSDNDFACGTRFYVEAGSTCGHRVWELVSLNALTINVSPLNFSTRLLFNALADGAILTSAAAGDVETVMQTATIPANTARIGDRYRLKVTWYCTLGTSADTFVPSVRANSAAGVTLWTAPAADPASDDIAVAEVDLVIAAEPGGAAAVRWTAHGTVIDASSPATATTCGNNTLATNADLPLVATGLWAGGNPGDTAVVRSMSLEKLNSLLDTARDACYRLLARGMGRQRA